MIEPFDAAAAVRHLRRVDPDLAAVIRKMGPCPLEPRMRYSPFEELLESIVYQQLSGKAAATIYGRVRALFPTRRALNPQALLDTPDDALRGAGPGRQDARRRRPHPCGVATHAGR